MTRRAFGKGTNLRDALIRITLTCKRSLPHIRPTTSAALRLRHEGNTSPPVTPDLSNGARPSPHADVMLAHVEACAPSLYEPDGFLPTLTDSTPACQQKGTHHHGENDPLDDPGA
ncbi:hypothetical protein J2D73_14385 [Acetobacter sacchari]|uniref:Uncharacterized protein n=1 Tax=Acetobacter sacchari TaxID=2661687 RepID=A0ABS3LYH6_9PROT|nr:hypothetical protein [Acetobacter sacchari]MBO1360974.1 hypothetical protein [Acetobacter sacchari]